MLIIVEVESDIQGKVVKKTLRTEDIQDYIEDAYDEDQTIINFYKELEPLIIQESFDLFHKRFSEIEAPYYDLENNDKSE